MFFEIPIMVMNLLFQYKKEEEPVSLTPVKHT